MLLVALLLSTSPRPKPVELLVKSLDLSVEGIELPDQVLLVVARPESLYFLLHDLVLSLDSQQQGLVGQGRHRAVGLQSLYEPAQVELLS